MSCITTQVVGSRFHWKHGAAGKVIEFESTPFTIGEKRDLHCQLVLITLAKIHQLVLHQLHSSMNISQQSALIRAIRMTKACRANHAVNKTPV